jgi:hypothetical protein
MSHTSLAERGPGVAPGRGEAQEGFAVLEVAVPSRLDDQVMDPSIGGLAWTEWSLAWTRTNALPRSR